MKGIHISLLLLQNDITALMIAVHHGHLHIVEVLTRFKPDVNLQNKVGVVTYCSVCTQCMWLSGIYDICNTVSLVRGTGSLGCTKIWDLVPLYQ